MPLLATLPLVVGALLVAGLAFIVISVMWSAESSADAPLPLIKRPKDR